MPSRRSGRSARRRRSSFRRLEPDCHLDVLGLDSTRGPGDDPRWLRAEPGQCRARGIRVRPAGVDASISAVAASHAWTRQSTDTSAITAWTAGRVRRAFERRRELRMVGREPVLPRWPQPAVHTGLVPRSVHGRAVSGQWNHIGNILNPNARRMVSASPRSAARSSSSGTSPTEPGGRVAKRRRGHPFQRHRGTLSSGAAAGVDPVLHSLTVCRARSQPSAPS